MNDQPDPLTLKLRNTLFEIRKKGFGKVRQGCTQGPLLGITLMTKRYKSKRKLDHNKSYQPYRQNDENSLKTEIFRRIKVSEPRRSNGLDIQKAVIHQTEQKKLRLSTQKSGQNREQVPCHNFSKDSLYKRMIVPRKVLNTHRENNQEMRNTMLKFTPKVIHSERPSSAYTQPFLRGGKSKDKTKSMEMQFIRKPPKNEQIEGWDVDNQEQFDFL